MEFWNGSSCAVVVVAALGMVLVAGCAGEGRSSEPLKLALLDPNAAPEPDEARRTRTASGGAKWAPLSLAITAMLPSGQIPPPPAPAAAPAADLRVMSFNCRVSTLFDLHNTWGLRKGLLLDTIRNFNPDLLGTQELVASQADYLRERLDGYRFVGAGRKDGKRRGEMCGVFFRDDKFEKLDAGHFWLSESPSKPGSKGWGAFFPRMVTWVKLRPRDGRGPTFCWFNTHLDAFSSRARSNGAKLLHRRIDSIAGGMPVLVTGDFNADAGSDPYRELTGGAMLADTFRAIHVNGMPGDGTRHAFRGSRAGPRIDWILASSGTFRTLDADIDHTRSGLMFPSDHFPVTAVLRPTAAAPAVVARLE